MSYNTDFDRYRSSDGSTTREGQDKWVSDEKAKGWTPSPQQHFESYEAYTYRINQHSN